MNTSTEAILKEHIDKHPGKTYEECFPDNRPSK